MKFVWGGERNQKYSLRIFSLNFDKPCETLTLCGADFYRVFFNGKFISYGPERTASGYARKRKFSLQGVKEIKIEVAGYNHNSYCCDYQLPFFGAEILSGEKVLYTSLDFTCATPRSKITDVSRFSGQRTGLEVYDFTLEDEREEVVYEVQAPVILEGIGDRCKYLSLPFNELSSGEFSGFYAVNPAFCEFNPQNLASDSGFLVQRDFLEKTVSGYKEINFALDGERTGFIKLNVEAKEKTEIFCVFEEYLENGNWTFRRSGCNDLLSLTVKEGKTEFQSFEPYALKHLKIIYKGKAEILPSLVTQENDYANFITVDGKGEIFDVFSSAKSTFCQNAVDIFTDCPGRERAGWLCDSFFTAKAERLFTGDNQIERAFLENIIISNTPELDYRMIPKSFPSESNKDHYIPNWAMWFVLELKDYYLRTGDRSLITLAKDRVYNLVDFFKKYENEYSLLEDLESWVFVEWSVCNKEAYIKGVNFPSNILFSAMLEAVDFMYNDKVLGEKAKVIKKNVINLSFDGKFFADNAVRENGKLVRCADHLSETCQYYALFFGLDIGEEFSNKMIKEFGPFRKEEVYPEVGKSAPFIGNYLRLYWLIEKGEKERALKEIYGYFYPMVEKTKTLWEHNEAKASCNHGFASAVAELILKCTVGYEGVKEGKPLFTNLENAKDYGLKIKTNKEGQKK